MAKVAANMKTSVVKGNNHCNSPALVLVQKLFAPLKNLASLGSGSCRAAKFEVK